MRPPDKGRPLIKSCLVCYEENIETAMAVDGRPEWIVAVMMKLGIPRRQAEATFDVILRESGGNYGSKVASGKKQRRQMVLRVCATCAEKSGATVDTLVPGTSVPCFREPLL